MNEKLNSGRIVSNLSKACRGERFWRSVTWVVLFLDAGST
jgi:hypothetical protein